MTTYDVAPVMDDDGEVMEWTVLVDGEEAEACDTEAEARDAARRLETEARDERARDMFREDLEGLDGQLDALSADQIRFIRAAMLDALLAARAMA